MTVARELAARNHSICILEAGGLRHDRRAQRCYEGEVAGNSYPPLHHTRLSAFGGSSQLWAGWCRPLDEIDFERRDWVANSGWPFKLEDLLPHYRTAHSICRLGPFEYDPEHWKREATAEPLPLSGVDFDSAIFHVNRLAFGTHYRRWFETTDGIRVLLHCAATRFHAEPTGSRIDHVSAVTPGGRELRVRARYFVLAGGGIENARLLLLSGETPARSIGNSRGLVGRFFTEHAFVHPGYFIPSNPARSLAFYFARTFPGMPPGASVRVGLTLNRATLQRERLLNAAVLFRPAHEGHPVFESPEVTAMLEIWEKLRGRGVPSEALGELSRALRAPHRLAVAAWRKLTVRGAVAPRWGLRTFFECESVKSNRIVLSDRRDSLGRPLSHVEWHLTELDIRSIQRVFRMLDESLRGAGLGHIELRFPDEPERWNAAAFGGKHHMGSTRMHPSPDRGVVDSDGRVHGLTNLFLAGSSVFPTAGFVNPTLTIVAMAVRLAEHLRGALQTESLRVD